MKKTPVLLLALRRLMFGASIAIVTAIARTGRADAQAVAIVNGDPITAFDVDQRAKLIQLSTPQTKQRNEVVEELINEKIKVQLLKRCAIDGVDKDVDNAYANMARRMRATRKQFSENLEKSGIKTETLKSKIKADLIWGQIIRGKYQSAFQFSDQEVNARLKTKNRGDENTVGYDYPLRPILFVVPRGSPPAAFEARVKEAEALRARFQSCDEGIEPRGNLPHGAVR